MQSSSNIPLLTDLIEKGIEITMSDLGLDVDPIITEDLIIEDTTEPDIYHEPEPVEQQQAGSNPFTENPELEHIVRRILDAHMERAWQEIKIAIQKQIERP